MPDDLVRDEIFLPEIDIFVFSQPVRILDYDRRLVCTPWTLIEFGFGDCRYSPDIHRIRDMEHAFFRGLERIFGCKPQWTVVTG
jgi:hypothetical protein